MGKKCDESASRFCVSAMASKEQASLSQVSALPAITLSARDQAEVAQHLAAHGVSSLRELAYYIEQKCLVAHAEAEKQAHKPMSACTYEALHAAKALRDCMDLYQAVDKS